MSHKRCELSGQESFERVAQKRRTRHALLVAARELLAEGQQPTVPEAADRAGISRATAYRYFSEASGMAEEAILDAIALEFEQLDLTAAMAKADLGERVADVVSAILAMVLKNEGLFRTYIGLVVPQGGKAKRGARRIGWLSTALAPLAETMPAADFTRLIHGLALLTGFETIIVLKDVCGLDAPDIDKTARWIAASLLATT